MQDAKTQTIDKECERGMTVVRGVTSMSETDDEIGGADGEEKCSRGEHARLETAIVEELDVRFCWQQVVEVPLTKKRSVLLSGKRRPNRMEEQDENCVLGMRSKLVLCCLSFRSFEGQAVSETLALQTHSLTQISHKSQHT